MILIILILLLSGCGILKFKKNRPVSDMSAAVPSSSVSSDSGSSDVVFLESQNYVSEALNQYSIEIFKNKFSYLLNCSLEPIANWHDPTVIDTIYTFANPKNEIKVYRASHQDFIYLFNVTNRVLKIKENIGPGMKKDLFFQKFQIPESNKNIVQISNPEGNMTILFYFENNRLRKINSQSYLD